MTAEKPIVVLLVEDEPSILMITAMILEDAGMQVHTARDGDEAEAWLRTGKADVLFTDINMPGTVTGRDLVTRHHDMRVLVTSGDGRDRHDWLPETTAYLTKPYDRKTLLAAVRDIAAPTLQQQQAPSSPERPPTQP
jgi:DNA-binding NtrC family response regulator